MLHVLCVLQGRTASQDAAPATGVEFALLEVTPLQDRVSMHRVHLALQADIATRMPLLLPVLVATVV